MTAEQFRELKPLKINARDEVRPRPASKLGTMSRLAMLPKGSLVVDETYQRRIVAQGKSNIVRILEEFDWRKFMPLVVVEIDPGRYAVIDGQHRATAALMHPAIELVPAMIVEATTHEAAEIFVAVNANVTAMKGAATYRARVAAGEMEANEIEAVCIRSGVKILGSPPPITGWTKGDTVAVGAITAVARAHGLRVLETVLRSVVDSGDGHPGLLMAVVIKAIAALVLEFKATTEEAVRAIGRANLHRRLESAKAAKAGSQEPLHSLLVIGLRSYFAEVCARVEAVEECAA